MSTDPQARERKWLDSHPALDIDLYGERLLRIVEAVQAIDEMTPETLRRILAQHRRGQPRGDSKAFSKDELVSGYRALCAAGRLNFDRETLRRLQMKPVRTLSGVAPVTVLTKAFACPGQCVFCPSDARMPKSYLADEPGVMRAIYHHFDPYEQTAARIRALENIGHSTAKVELLILGGTWSAYPVEYQEWFLRRCLDALNGQTGGSLQQAQTWNEDASHRNVGLVIETRPDAINPEEVLRLRRLGVTKVQLGLQSLCDRILTLNARGHTVEDTRQAIRQLRLAGFKIAVHWMPNLHGATPDSDREDFGRLWTDPAIRPDELKIYPCVLLGNTPLYDEWLRGAYAPYDDETLLRLVSDCKTIIPPYCRVNRVIRDIPAAHIIAGSRKSNLRQLVHVDMTQRSQRCRCIRCREVRNERIDPAHVRWQTLVYGTDVTTEWFLSAETPGERLVGFLRLSLPKRGERARLASDSRWANAFDEIEGCGMIRQVQVYGPMLDVGWSSQGDAQHAGIGRNLLEQARRITRQCGFRRLGVIAATGTRDYYRRNGFVLGDLYMTCDV